MSKLYVRSKVHTSVDRVRKALNEAERRISTLGNGHSRGLELLRLFDQIERDLQELDRLDVDVRVERTQFETLQRQLDSKKRRFLKDAGRSLAKERTRTDPSRSRWWWYLDERAARQRRRRLMRLALGTAAVMLVLAGAWLAYQRFLAPPPEIGRAFRHLEAGQSDVASGNLRAALVEFDAASELVPDDPEPRLWKGAVHHQIGETEKAETAFAAARPLYESTFDYMLNRGRVHLQAGNLERAKVDIETAAEMDPRSGWVHYLRAGVATRERDYDAALTHLERASELANENGNTRLESMIITQGAQLKQMQTMPTGD